MAYCYILWVWLRYPTNFLWVETINTLIIVFITSQNQNNLQSICLSSQNYPRVTNSLRGIWLCYIYVIRINWCRPVSYLRLWCEEIWVYCRLAISQPIYILSQRGGRHNYGKPPIGHRTCIPISRHKVRTFRITSNQYTFFWQYNDMKTRSISLVVKTTQQPLKQKNMKTVLDTQSKSVDVSPLTLFKLFFFWPGPCPSGQTVTITTCVWRLDRFL